MNYRLRTKLSISYGIISLLIVALIAAMSVVLVDKHFIAYVEENNERNIDNVVHSLEHQYHISEGWSKDKVSDISERALKDGLVLDVRDSSGSIVWDASAVFNMSDEELLAPIEKTMESRYKGWKGKITERSLPLHFGTTDIGTVIIKYYEPFFFTGHDLDFINMLYKILMIAMLVSIIFAGTLGIWISRQISIPISKTIGLTKEISEGNYKRRIDTKTTTSEINDLSGAVNLLAERLEEQEAIRKRIVSDVSHELRTPLTAIQNHMEALIDGIWEPTPERLSNIQREIFRINRMVGDLSKLARYENRIEKLNKSIFNIGNVINRIITDFEGEIHNKKLSIEVNYTVQTICADEDKISQVVINILSNAIKYTKENGKINIETYKNDSEIIIKIKDTGIGIPKEDLPFIFERFYRVDKSRNKASGGSGVGLTIVKTIIEAHNGQIEVKSDLGVGTEFVIKLPQM